MPTAARSPANDLSRAEAALDRRLSHDLPELRLLDSELFELIRMLRRGTAARELAATTRARVRRLIARAEGRP